VLVKALPYFRLQSQIPRLPDLSKKGEALVNEIKTRDKAARSFPARGDKIGELGTIYQANLFTKEAERCLEIAGRLSPENPRWPYCLAYIRQQMGESQGAEALLRRVIALAPDYAPAQLKLADLGFKSGEAGEAEAIYLKLSDDKTVGTHACLGLARIAMDKGRWEDGRSFLEKAIRMDPQFKSAYRLLATISDHFGRTDEAEIFRERAGIERFAEAPDPWVEELAAVCFDPKELMRLANVSFQTNRYERAFGLYKRALDLEPDNPENVLEVAQRVFDSGNREPARNLFLKALTIRPNDETALYHVATIDYLAGRLEDARATYDRLLRAHPQSVDGWTGLGDVSIKNGDFQKAELSYRKALAINPQAPRVQYALGKLEMARGNSHLALGYFQRAAALDPGSADAWFSIGAIMAQQGRLEEAIVDYKKALRENPEFGLAHYNLANALYRQGKLAEARERYRRAIECDPEVAEAHLNLGTLLAEEGQRDEARNSLQTALSLALAQGNSPLEEAIRAELKKLSSASLRR
jgi:tetratricopeptide (TPR) repeat protein